MGLHTTLRALADPIRREILNLLKLGRLAAGDISAHFAVTDASISRHLSVLKDAELVVVQREGKFLLYSLYCEPLEFLDDWINDFLNED